MDSFHPEDMGVNQDIGPRHSTPVPRPPATRALERPSNPQIALLAQQNPSNLLPISPFLLSPATGGDLASRSPFFVPDNPRGQDPALNRVVTVAVATPRDHHRNGKPVRPFHFNLPAIDIHDQP